MDERTAQQEIDAILNTLNAAKASAGLGSDDPSVLALEQIMMAKVAALEAARLQTPAEIPAARIASSTPDSTLMGDSPAVILIAAEDSVRAAADPPPQPAAEEPLK